VRARTAESATAISRQFLDLLGLQPGDIAQLHEMPVERLLAEATKLAMPIDAGLASSANPEAFMPMQPVLDGTVLTHHPVDPVGAPT
jgi:hypothetical protein